MSLSREASEEKKPKNSLTLSTRWALSNHSTVVLLDVQELNIGRWQATAVPELDEKLRKQCLHLLYKICKDRKMLPASYILQQGSLYASATHIRGGFADVGTGDYLGHRVAIKHLKLWAKDAPDKVFKVLGSSPI